MRKNILFACAVTALLVGVFMTKSSSQQKKLVNMTLTETEAIAGCEITKKGKVVLDCSGTKSCSTTYLGYTLTCDGQKVN